MRDAAREGRRRSTRLVARLRIALRVSGTRRTEEISEACLPSTRLVTNLPHVMCPSARENETEVEPQVRLAAYK